MMCKMTSMKSNKWYLILSISSKKLNFLQESVKECNTIIQLHLMKTILLCTCQNLKSISQHLLHTQQAREVTLIQRFQQYHSMFWMKKISAKRDLRFKSHMMLKHILKEMQAQLLVSLLTRIISSTRNSSTRSLITSSNVTKWTSHTKKLALVGKEKFKEKRTCEGYVFLLNLI
jgi:hypothetical protein